MKYLVLGMFSLALLGFVCAKNEKPSFNVTTNSTWPNGTYNSHDSMGSASGDNNMGTGSGTGSGSGTGMGTGPSSGSGSNNGTGGDTAWGTDGSGSKNGQSHVFASVTLLFGSFLLQALWK